MRRKRKTKTRRTLFLWLFIAIFGLTAGYGLLSNNIRVTGRATAPLQNKLNNQLNIYSSPYYSQIVTANPDLSRNAEVLTGGNTLTSTYNVTTSRANNRTWQTRLTYTNLYYYTLTGGTYTTSTTCSAVTRTVTLSTATLARNATVTINVTLTHNTKKNRNCSVTTTVTYTYGGVTKYLYYIIAFL